MAVLVLLTLGREGEGDRMRKRDVGTVLGIGAAVGALALGAGPAHSADLDIFAGTTTTTTSVTLKLTAPSLNSCNSTVVLKGTPSEPTSTIAWSGTDQLLSTDPALKDTPHFAGADAKYFGPRSITLDLAPGSYTAFGKCTPYDSSGNYAGDDVQYLKTFTIGGNSNPQPGGDPSAWGSVGKLFG